MTTAMTKLLKILSLPITVEFLRLLVFIALGGMFAQSGLLDAASVVVTAALFFWIGWRTQRFGNEGIAIVVTASILFAVFLFLLAASVYIIGSTNVAVAQAANVSAVIAGLAFSHAMFLPPALLFSLLGWYIARRLSARIPNQ
jgi:hypothetical protein